ncbi:ComF family protein [Leucobacter triazinivorans]|uniref:ComF family protein n=1 Tax=Leucobacter triazinivorans TaxID=1784719 RepID=A0A4P6KEB1_9MICO|nr:phosphoribosyltransferase family protein [Leucobacter triazinivorans]QBE48533.1 ComF family protein [Leucobacter triazinivorans]
MHLSPLLRELRLDLLALVWPTECVCCGQPDRDCCLPCLVEVQRPGPLLHPAIGVPCVVRGPYDGPLRALLVAFKHEGRTGFARELGAQLRPPLVAALGRCSGPAPPVIVAAPSRGSRVRQRGYRHLELLLDVAMRGERGGRTSAWQRQPAPGGRIAALRVRALRATRGRAGQVGLGPAERARNAARVAVRHSARAVLRGREVILVDDVITTGATVLAAGEALERAGARLVAVVALCAAQHRDTRDEDFAASRVETESPGGVEFRKGVTVRHTGPPA